MKISTKGRYAVRMLVDLAEHQQNGYVALKDIAARQEISKKYLEQIVAILNRPGFLQTNRGQNGGYRLAKPADRYTVGDILRITEGGIAPVACLEDEVNHCEKAKNCATLPVWAELNRIISEYLDSVTIQDILDKQRESYEYDFMI
ncbi:MAG: Rrf2 family transcriptional regulator [Eubacterium sp.]|nr:Rrf2 family transcriptional regulator [Eubacterium sp.]